MLSELKEVRREKMLDRINSKVRQDSPMKFKNDYHSGKLTAITPIGGILGLGGIGATAYILVCVLIVYYRKMMNSTFL